MTNGGTVTERPADFDPYVAPAPADLVRWYGGLMWKIALRWWKTNRGIDQDDLFSCAKLGFLRAVSEYDPARGVRFATYAAHWARMAIGRFVRNELSRGVHIPEQLPMADLRHVAMGSCRRRSDEWDDWLGTVPDRDHADPDPDRVPWDVLVAGLRTRERQIVEMRVAGGASLAEVAAALGLSRERVRQIEKTALDRLRWSRRGLGVALGLVVEDP